MQQIFKGMDNGANAIDANFNELTSPSYSPTVTNVTASGTVISKKMATTTTNFNGVLGMFTRIGNTVIVKLGDNRPSQVNNWTQWNGFIPVGYRPASETQGMYYSNSGFGTIGFYPAGYAINFVGQVNSGSFVQGFSSWVTTDDFPS